MSSTSTKSLQIARNFLSRLNQSQSCCPHHSNGAEPLVGKKCSSTQGSTEYGFEMVSSTLRFGKGVTSEIGYDVKNLKSKNPVVITDKQVIDTKAFKAVAESLKKLDISFDVFDRVKCEPSDRSVNEAIEFARKKHYDCFIAVGGGSVIDTAKAAALYAANPGAELMDFFQKPFGKALIPENPMQTLIAIPTTAGTGSETTGAAIFDLPEKKCKSGIRMRMIKPHLAIVDPLNVLSMPRNVAIYSGFDVLCHALESYTVKPYYKRSPKPERPELRPLYNGSNPVSDVWVRETLQKLDMFFRRSIFDPEDVEARTEMLMAASFAGMGFGNAGVHLCHALSYPISSQGKKYTDPNYENPLIPHGLSVVITSPADFLFTVSADPQRHLEAAKLLGADLPDSASPDLIGNKLADILRGFMRDFKVPNGLSELGFETSKIDDLADAGTHYFVANPIMPKDADKEIIAKIYEKSWTVY